MGPRRDGNFCYRGFHSRPKSRQNECHRTLEDGMTKNGILEWWSDGLMVKDELKMKIRSGKFGVLDGVYAMR